MPPVAGFWQPPVQIKWVPKGGLFLSPFFENVLFVRETEILVEQQTPQGVLFCVHAGLVINQLFLFQVELPAELKAPQILFVETPDSCHRSPDCGGLRYKSHGWFALVSGEATGRADHADRARG